MILFIIKVETFIRRGEYYPAVLLCVKIFRAFEKLNKTKNSHTRAQAHANTYTHAHTRSRARTQRVELADY